MQSLRLPEDVFVFSHLNRKIEVDLQAAVIEEEEVVDAQGEFAIPAAPILIPSGPWTEIEGSICAPKGFKAQGKDIPS